MPNLEVYPGIKAGRQNTNNLRYTDDTVLIAENKVDLQRLFDIEEESRKKVLELNNKETEIMVSVEAMSVHRSTSLSIGKSSHKGINSNTWVLGCSNTKIV